MFKTLLVCCIFIIGAASLALAQEQKKLKPGTESALKRIDAARTIYPVKKPADREALRFLVEIGANEKFLVALDTWEIIPVADSFRKRSLPKEFAKQLSQKPYVELLATLGDPEATTVDLKNKIKKSVAKRLHLHRLHLSPLETDYDESFSSFAKVTDPRIIRLAGYLMDYYENKQHICGLRKSFPKGRASYETGGIFFLKKDGSKTLKIAFLPLPPDPDNPLLNSYAPLGAEGYLPIVSNVHTHPVGRAKAQRYSGPSGLSTDWPDPIIFYGGGDRMPSQMPSDFLSLGYANQTNPFRVEVVVSLIGRRSFNIDLYFRDVITGKDGTHSNVRAGTVLDLGIYYCKK